MFYLFIGDGDGGMEMGMNEREKEKRGERGGIEKERCK